MQNRYFLKYFRFNKFFLQYSGVLPFSSWGFMVNGIFIVIPLCTCSFLVLPGLYIMISHRNKMAAMGMLNIFCELLEILMGAFKGIFHLF